MGDRPGRAGPGRRPTGLRPVRPGGHDARAAPVPRAPPRPHPGPPRRRAEQGAIGLAAAEPGDVAEPAPAPELRRGVPVRAPAGRPPPEAAGAAEHWKTGPPARGLPGADPRPSAGVHLVGSVRGQSSPSDREPQPAGDAGCPAERSGYAGRTGPVRAVWATNGGPVLGAERPAVVHLHPRVGGLRGASVPGIVERGSPGRSGHRAVTGGRRSGRPGGEPGRGGRGRAAAGRTDPAVGAPAGAGGVRRRSGVPPVPGVRAREPARRPRTRAPLGGRPQGPAAGRRRVRPVRPVGTVRVE